MAFTSEPETATLDGVRFRMGDQTDEEFLVGRDEGQRIRWLLEREMQTHRFGEEPVAIDFEGIRGMTVPFAREFFVPLLGGRLLGRYDDHPIFVMHAVEDVYETLEAVMLSSDLAVLSLSPRRDRPSSLLGGEPALQEAMRVAEELRDFNANDLATRLGVSAQSANNRLKQLVRLGSLVRVPVVLSAGGREYRYRLPASDAAPQPDRA